ncbi:MAG: hypothetical protein DME43_01495 [Verrucomicrobia bacterium]|nr:MAG: hypothetical protein DME43_01495 [Verrucomicrobiota bacterium]
MEVGEPRWRQAPCQHLFRTKKGIICTQERFEPFHVVLTNSSAADPRFERLANQIIPPSVK